MAVALSTRCNLGWSREPGVKPPLPFREFGVRSCGSLQRPAPVAGIALTLLGLPTLAIEGRPVVPPPGAKELGLLAYLALTGGSHTREELAGLLWGESPEAEARASLRQALKHLRDRV